MAAQEDHRPMSPGPTRGRSLRLPAASLLLLAALVLLPANRAWVAGILHDYAQLGRQIRTRGIAERMSARYYRNYAVLEYVARSLRPDDLLLLPPADYVKRHFDPVYWNWAEPRYFYYVLGRRPTVTLDSPLAGEATCTVVIDDRGRPAFTTFSGRADLERLRAAFAK
jgi:hypothetical protein